MLDSGGKNGPTMMARISMMRALNFGKGMPKIERRKPAKAYKIIRSAPKGDRR
jgi:hypothetical protein